MKSKAMTPAKAIDVECRQCMNTPNRKADCGSEICKLNDARLSKLKKMKAHCITCVPEQSIFGVQSCTGKLMDGTICLLHPYRLGHNPALKGKGRGASPDDMKRMRDKRGCI